jgi:D-amino peptidase
MRIFISADIEGVAGVVSPLHGQPGNGEYERARRLMTEEVSAAVAGAFDGGATEVVVNDSHGPMINLLPELLDPRAELILGRPKPMNMFASLDGGFAGVFCTGYHSGAGRHGVLSHTINGFAFAAIRLNGIDCAEATLYGAYAGSLGVPCRAADRG